jgi:hypothetical protein
MHRRYASRVPVSLTFEPAARYCRRFASDHRQKRYAAARCGCVLAAVSPEPPAPPPARRAHRAYNASCAFFLFIGASPPGAHRNAVWTVLA